MRDRTAFAALALLALGSSLPSDLSLSDSCCPKCEMCPPGNLQLYAGDKCPKCDVVLVTMAEMETRHHVRAALTDAPDTITIPQGNPKGPKPSNRRKARKKRKKR